MKSLILIFVAIAFSIVGLQESNAQTTIEHVHPKVKKVYTAEVDGVVYDAFTIDTKSYDAILLKTTVDKPLVRAYEVVYGKLKKLPIKLVYLKQGAYLLVGPPGTIWRIEVISSLKEQPYYRVELFDVTFAGKLKQPHN